MAWPGNAAEGGDLVMPISKPKMPGLIKGLGVTLRTLGNTIRNGADTVQYPREKEAPTPAPAA